MNKKEVNLVKECYFMFCDMKNSELKETMEILENELSRSNIAIAEGLEVKE